MYPCTYKWPTAVTRGSIKALENAIVAENGGATGADDVPITHHFLPNVYGREMTVKAGTTIVGKIHRHKHMCVVLSGRFKVVSEFGEWDAKAGDIIISEPGTKRALYAYEDSRWLNIHPNHEDTRDLDAIEAYVIAPDYESLGLDPAKQIEVA